MDWLAILLFALSSNLDNFLAAITYGTRSIRIGAGTNLLIAGITGGSTLGCMLAGGAAARLLPGRLPGLVGGALMTLLGVCGMADALRKHLPVSPPGAGRGRLSGLLDAPETADADGSGTIDRKEAAVLALALSINNMGLGLGASIAGFDPWITAAAAAALSFAAIWGGCLAGRRWASRLFGRLGPFAAGAAMAALGVFEMLFAG